MVKFKKICRKIALIFLVVVPVSGFAHFILFPAQTRSILIDFSAFKHNGRLYFDGAVPQSKVDTVQAIIELASDRVAAFWGQKTCRPKYIYCEREEEFKKFGSSFPVPALTHMKWGSCIVISNQGVDLDIVAHEISHAELYERTGFYNWSVKIPRWFDEGLAMQNDARDYYSEDTLKVKSNNYKNLPDIKKSTSGKQFNEEGSREQIMLNFMTAKHEIRKWYTKEKLEKFIKAINAGKSFEEAFGQ